MVFDLMTMYDNASGYCDLYNNVARLKQNNLINDLIKIVIVIFNTTEI